MNKEDVNTNKMSNSKGHNTYESSINETGTNESSIKEQTKKEQTKKKQTKKEQMKNEQTKKEQTINESDTSKSNTKKQIQDVALSLFSKRGYQAVSIRDIGKIVGIKESTIYYHYKNKQDIIESIFLHIEQLIQVMNARFQEVFSKITEINVEAFCFVAVNFVKGYLLNPYVYQCIGMLTIERRTDPKADQLYQRFVIDLPLQNQEKVFEEMMKRGLMKRGNSKVLAMEYYSAIYFNYSRYCLGKELVEGQDKLIDEVMEYMQEFYSTKVKK